MPLTRPFAIDQAYANASDFRKQHAAVFPREGVFPDPVTTAAAGIAYANGGWNIAARIFTAVARRGTAAFSQAYGSALISNDSQATAWTIPAAPSSGSRIDLLWVKATDPTQGDATTTPSGETVARAVPLFGVTSGDAATTPTAPALPSGAIEIARVSTASTATSAAGSVFSHTYAFANIDGATLYVRNASTLTAAHAAAAVVGEVAYALDTQSSYEVRQTGATRRWARRGGGFFTGTRTQAVGNGPDSDIGAVARIDTESTRDDFISVAGNGVISLVEGEYAVSALAIIPSPVTGRSFVGLKDASSGQRFARSSFGTGEDTTNAASPIFVGPGGRTLRVHILQVTGAERNVEIRLTVTKVG